MFRSAIIFTAMLLSGIVVGRIASSPRAVQDGDFAEEAATGVTSPRQLGPAPTGEEILRRMLEKSKLDPDSSSVIEDELKNWTTAELKTALDDMMLETDFQVSSSALWWMNRLLLKTLITRDAKEASAWLTGIENPVARTKMILVAGDVWPDHLADEGVKLVFSNKEMINDRLAHGFLRNAFLSRSKEGPVAVGKLLAEITSHQREFPLQTITPLPGFDMRELARQPGFDILLDRESGSHLLGAWCSVDKEGAYDWLLENKGPASLVALGGDPDTMKLLGSRYQELEAKDRPEFLAAIYEKWKTASRDPFAETDSLQGGAELMSSLSSPEDVKEVAALGVSMISDPTVVKRFNRGLSLLKAVEDPDMRIQILEDATPGNPISADEEAKLRDALREWNADDARIEKIMGKFKP